MHVRVMRRAKRNDQEKTSSIRWWHLKGEKQRNFQRRILKEASWETQRSANKMWEEMAKRIRKVAKKGGGGL